MSSYAPMDIVYPDSDGKPMGENLYQAQLIRMLIHGFELLYADNPMVLVGGDCFWYPVQGEPTICTAPDVILVFDTPKALHPSIRTWAHGGHVRFVAEITSPSNSYVEMRRKREFYEEHGVEEYWVFDPESASLEVWVRNGDGLTSVLHPERGWFSSLLGVTVQVARGELRVTEITGRRWLHAVEEAIVARRQAERLTEAMAVAEAAEKRAQAAAARAISESARAETESARAETESARADEAERRLVEMEAELDRLRSAPSLE